MAGYHRPIRHFEQLRPQESGTGWVVLWETKRIADEATWSAAGAGSEKEALERAQHFIRLGFHVHAIRDPLGSVFMDEEAIASHFRPAPQPEPSP
jgi:hypothetical protein